MLKTINFFYISQSIQEWSNWVEKKLNDLFSNSLDVSHKYLVLKNISILCFS